MPTRTPSRSGAVEAVDLVKTYPGGRGRPDVTALDGLTLTVPGGTVHGLLGPNGAGKSTTTKVLTTLSRATSGTARVAGHDVVRDADDVRRAVGLVSQGTGADPLLTPRENLVMAARLRGANRADASARAAALLDRFRLGDAGDRRTGGLSGGTRRKLDVALGLVDAPRVLFLDEPTTGLDPEARAAMWDEIRRLAGEDALTVLLTTHYLEEADRLADGLSIVDRGRVVAAGTPDDLKATLAGDTLTVDLVEPAADEVRRAVAPVLDDVTVHVEGPTGRLVARTPDGPAVVGAVITALQHAGVRHGAVAVSRPTLDDVYLRYAGRSWSEVAR
ncbi:ATP-binding cassette domain-containing protein [Cellulomonas fimi]|uniref:ABC transporter related protein n=1 Tax=Cellulomonas fimi (strain ATCC 484 / DSM 20113 / JCM 1341 / CCUG 24087 / LMG 16345 / NBRC 15513 / NCIMB 8980 / NCTC 7547 / NRS-133) TaxID=590998 RepID=F4H5D1_CELFA|nr:ATP-binding cassette domain-containing protein [Cellulomonas fimi]AEE47854.1 ABC transporter related protein [Cellulomonas fimi ATCC 484]NNH06008.1 ATP-binding cassette domain-containing protein [Cellulomonas fimi]